MLSDVFSCVPGCSELLVSASVAEYLLKLKGQSEVMLACWTGNCVLLWDGRRVVFFPSCKQRDVGKKECERRVLEKHSWFCSFLLSGTGKYCCKMMLGGSFGCVCECCALICGSSLSFTVSYGQEKAVPRLHPCPWSEALCSHRAVTAPLCPTCSCSRCCPRSVGEDIQDRFLAHWWTADKCNAFCKWELGRLIYGPFAKKGWVASNDKSEEICVCLSNRKSWIHCTISPLQVILPALFLWFHFKWLFADVCFLELDTQIGKRDCCGHVIFLKKVKSAICIYLVSSGWIFTKSLWVSWEICALYISWEILKTACLEITHCLLFSVGKLFFPYTRNLLKSNSRLFLSIGNISHYYKIISRAILREALSC